MTQLFTLGHSNRTLAGLVDLLRAHQLELVVDIRRVPRSGRHPQFNADNLALELPRFGVRYRSVPELGGRRSRSTDTPHIALTDPAIAGYADYMDTAAFADVAARLIDVAGRYRTGIMCAEAHWTSCHRRLLSDWLVANDVTVLHAVDASAPSLHALTTCARIAGRRVVYDLGQQPLLG